MKRIAPLSGYPEYLPAQAAVEARAIDIVRHTFELHGFARIETRAVEPLEELSRKGEITKEVYVVRRLHADADDTAELGLHYDLTIPFARYVLENSGHLQFPFRRHQIQKAWRGERPQEGRFREFLQADVDIVGQDVLAGHHDAEAIMAVLETLGRLREELGIPAAVMRISNRKVAQGYFEAIGIADPATTMQRVDKRDKIGDDGVRKLLAADGLSTDHIDAVLRLAAITSEGTGFVAAVEALGVDSELMRTGVEELATLVDIIAARHPGEVLADLGIARGLDYYTGTVYEIQLVGHENLGAIGAGGRYDTLAADNRHTYPGVGVSLGLSRLLHPLMASGAITGSRSVPSCVLVAVDDEATRAESNAVADALRGRGIACEVAPKPDKFGKQIRYADRRGIPFVWFGGTSGQVKDIRTGEQADAVAAEWTPPAEDLRVGIVHSG